MGDVALDSRNITALMQGEVPESDPVLSEITVGMDFLTDFLRKQYLEKYIPEGGSKIKFVTGRAGAGKTHFSRMLRAEAEKAGFLTAQFSARKVWLNDFREIYLEILRQCDIERILHGCADAIIKESGYDPALIPEGKTFMDYLAEKDEGDPLSKSMIRGALRKYFTKNPLLDNSFASCCSLLTGDILGHPVLEPANRELLYRFLMGDKTVKLSQLRALGLSPSRITRFNARHLLRSLTEVIHIAGYAGLLVVVDDMEILTSRASGEMIRYTKTRRDDTYESIRQLIDDIDSMRYLMFVFCFDRELIENENLGIKSYSALWMRIQNEVVSTRFNRFADILDMDRLADEIYTPEVLCAMSEKLADVVKSGGGTAAGITREKAEKLIYASQYGGLGLPYMVNRAVMTEDKGDE